MQRHAISLFLAIAAAACVEEPPELASTTQGIQLAGNAFVPDTSTCSRSVDEHWAKHSYMGGPVAADRALPDGGVARELSAGTIILNPRYGCAFLVRWGMWEKWKIGRSADGRPGPLYGYPVSDELSPGAGRSMQYFDTGSMWWRSDIGVRAMTGALAAKHFAMGSAAGYPIEDQTSLGIQAWGPERVEFVLLENDMRLYWSRDAGAWSVRGAIRARYENHVERYWLGLPISDESCEADGSCSSRFQWGQIYRGADGTTSVWTFPGARNTEVDVGAGATTFWKASGSCSATIAAHRARNAWLGAPVGGETPLANFGAQQGFERGTIVLNPSVPCAYFVMNGFSDVWSRTDVATGPYGYPASDELWTDPGRAHQFFQRGSMWWTPTGLVTLTGLLAVKHASVVKGGGYPQSAPQAIGAGQVLPLESTTTLYLKNGATRAFELHRLVLSEYVRRGGPTSALGFPTSDTICAGALCWADFEVGTVECNVQNLACVYRPPAVVIPPPPTKPTVTVTVENVDQNLWKQFVARGMAAYTIRWSVTGGTAPVTVKLKATTIGPVTVLDMNPVPLQGSVLGTSPKDTKYEVTATNAAGTVRASVWVLKDPLLTTPPQTCTTFYFRVTRASTINPCTMISACAVDLATARAAVQSTDIDATVTQVSAQTYANGCTP